PDHTCRSRGRSAERVSDSLSLEHVASAGFFVHGTTIGLNALLQGSGARTGLLCTRGFRDTLEMRRADRDVMYDLFWKQPPPLVRRRHRVPVSERIRADGEMITPLREADIDEALALFQNAGVEA